MWSLVLAIFLAFAKGETVYDEVDTEANDDCQLRTSEVCRSDKIPVSFPGSEPELEITCNAIKDYFLCGISVEERCQFVPESIPIAHKILTIVNEVCDKDSQLYKDIVESLGCIKGFIDDRIGESCFTPFPEEEIIEKHKKDLIDLGVITLDDVDNKCLTGVHALACLTLKMGNTCGEVAMNAFVKIFAKAAFTVFEGCDNEVGELLPIAVSLHKLEEAKEAKLRATTETPDICKIPLNETCIPNQEAFIIPETKEQLDQACKAEIDYVECIIQVEEKCQFNPEDIPELGQALKSTRKICNKDTALYESLAANIKCVKPLFDNSLGDCKISTLNKEEIEGYAASLQSEEIPVFTTNDEDQAECVKGLYAFACSASQIEKHCRENAMEALVTVLSIKTQRQTKACSKEFHEHLLDVISVLKVKEEKEEEIERILENILK